MRRSPISALVVSVVLSLLAARGATAASPHQIRFDLNDGNFIVGFSYDAPHRQSALPVVVMIHGASDTHTVFDFAPGFRAAPELAALGFPVLALDRAGYGASSHPNGDTLTFATSAGYVHEVIQAVRGGALGFTPPAIVLLGPSAGADIALVEAGTYHDVDGLIIVSNTSQLQPALFDVDFNAFFAQGDYFDFGVDFRTNFFYAKPFAIRRIIDLDNATRALVPRAEIGSALMGASAPFRAQITAPVLLLQADHDAIFIPVDDSALFSASSDVSFTLLRHTGHKLFEHPTSHALAVLRIADWVADRF
jgi:pimeloyl-ACP methyl ester carboxylesterase